MNPVGLAPGPPIFRIKVRAAWFEVHAKMARGGGERVAKEERVKSRATLAGQFQVHMMDHIFWLN